MFNTYCKNDCRVYYDRWQRVTAQSLCDCQRDFPDELQSTYCMEIPGDLLCQYGMFCYDNLRYQYNVCGYYACGRQIYDEDTWRQCGSATYRAMRADLNNPDGTLVLPVPE